MADFEKAYAPLKSHEGGWINNQADRGGETYAGISRKFFPSWEGWAIIDAEKVTSAYKKNASAFSAHLSKIEPLNIMVRDWYRTNWWDPWGLGRFPQALADEIFEQAVNLGKGGSGKYIQRVCNSFNLNKKTGKPLFVDLVEDGVVGPKTLSAMSTLLKDRTNDAALVHALNCMQGAHYIGLAAKTPSQRTFVDGWMKRAQL
ncbi:hypothetical protein LJC71_04925 [Desulfosarcina sp. OttesenSCG-928-A07]|nr:hypothetical protein [Desulfosarcina sp. OttesenSCG-928-G17]MDL2329081.1 hypothetical protein [Desulfosarcina sp. OttesenSCG-928-A07]